MGKFLKNEFEKDYFKKLSEFIEIERKTQIVFPPLELTFAALNTTSHEKVKVVILGQDPYHNHNQANGLSFSVKNGVNYPTFTKKYFQRAAKRFGI